MLMVVEGEEGTGSQEPYDRRRDIFTKLSPCHWGAPWPQAQTQSGPWMRLGAMDGPDLRWAATRLAAGRAVQCPGPGNREGEAGLLKGHGFTLGLFPNTVLSLYSMTRLRNIE